MIFILIIISLWVVVSFVRLRIFSKRGGEIIQNTKPFKRTGTNKQKILVLGDSLAYGTGTSSPEKSVAGLVASYYPGATVINNSVNGMRTKELAEESKKLEGQYDLILIIIGGNDVLRPWINLDVSGQNLRTIYSNTSKHSKNVIAITTGNLRYTTVFLWPLRYVVAVRSVQLRDKALTASKDLPNVTYINMVKRNTKVPFDKVKEAPDHLHLSDEGAQYWYEAILDSGALKPL